MQFHETPRLPIGFSATGRNCGIKPEAHDLSLFFSEVPAQAAALFTRNHFPGAPVVLGRERLRAGVLQAIVANSRVSNVATGPAGIEDARKMARAAADELGIDEALVLPSSTGVIGRRLPLEKIERGLVGMSGQLAADPWPAARGIMTTDSQPKVLSLEVDGATISAVGKGAGMISPNLATMLVYIFTDAEASASVLDRLLRRAAVGSFNSLSVDTDTSTSDTVVLLANGRFGRIAEERFSEGLNEICFRMAQWLARDGEGATKLLRIRVRGARNDTEASRIARSIVDSPLIKTMAYGADPNVGRILMAIGKCADCEIVPEKVMATVQGETVIREGMRTDFVSSEVRELLSRDPLDIEVDLGIADGTGIGLGCDLTEGYVRENAAYESS